MATGWEAPGHDEIEFEVRPVRSPRAGGSHERVVQSLAAVDAARRGAVALRLAAGVIASATLVGFALYTFWPDDDGFSPGGTGLRQQIGGFLAYVGTPLALAALVFAASHLVALHAARLDLDIEVGEGTEDGRALANERPARSS